LPDRYVPAITCKNNELVLPQVKCSEFNGYFAKAKAEEVKWTETAAKIDWRKMIMFFGLHFMQQSQYNPVDLISVITLLPLLSEKSATFASVKHGMDCLKIISFANDLKKELFCKRAKTWRQE